MPAQLKEVLYTPEAVVEGGRKGHGRTSDGRLEVDLSVPATMSGDDGPGTNPEQLFAIGYAACFQSALLGVAEGRKLDATGSQIRPRVGIGPLDAGGFGLQVSLEPPTCGRAKLRPSSRYRYAHNGSPSAPFAVNLNTCPCWITSSLLDRQLDRGIRPR
jgi:Ohr subfamily peroxiredoxin